MQKNNALMCVGESVRQKNSDANGSTSSEKILEKTTLALELICTHSDDDLMYQSALKVKMWEVKDEWPVQLKIALYTSDFRTAAHILRFAADALENSPKLEERFLDNLYDYHREDQ